MSQRQRVPFGVRRAMRNLADEFGLTLASVGRTRNGHYSARLRRSDGTEKTIISAGTSSDHAGARNERARVKAFAEGMETTP